MHSKVFDLLGRYYNLFVRDIAKNLDIVTLDCGHWIQQEKPRETNEALSKWLNVQKVNYGFI